jgi:hypothetical protein
MATRPKKITVSVTPGKNTPVNHVIRFEDLLQKVQKGVAKRARTRAAAPGGHDADLGSIRQLAADLESLLREARQASPDKTAPVPARRAAGRGRKKA